MQFLDHFKLDIAYSSKQIVVQWLSKNQSVCESDIAARAVFVVAYGELCCALEKRKLWIHYIKLVIK